MSGDYLIELTGVSTESSHTYYFTDPVTNRIMYVNDRHIARYSLITGSVSGDIPFRFELGNVSLNSVLTVAPSSKYEFDLEIEIRMMPGDAILYTHFDAYGRPSYSEIEYPNSQTATLGVSVNSTLLLSSNISLLSSPEKISLKKFTLLQQGTAIKSVEVPQFKVYPNPASEELVIENGDRKVENENVGIYDLSGRCVLSQHSNFNSPLKINVSHLPAGVYFVRVNGQSLKWIKR